MTRRQLSALLYWLDRVPPCTARWELEAVVLELLTEGEPSTLPAGVSESGVFPRE